jgi:hypothetical protein
MWGLAPRHSALRSAAAAARSQRWAGPAWDEQRVRPSMTIQRRRKTFCSLSLSLSLSNAHTHHTHTHSLSLSLLGTHQIAHGLQRCEARFEWEGGHTEEIGQHDCRRARHTSPAGNVRETVVVADKDTQRHSHECSSQGNARVSPVHKDTPATEPRSVNKVDCGGDLVCSGPRE